MCTFSWLLKSSFFLIFANFFDQFDVGSLSRFLFNFSSLLMEVIESLSRLLCIVLRIARKKSMVFHLNRLEFHQETILLQIKQNKMSD